MNPSLKLKLARSIAFHVDPVHEPAELIATWIRSMNAGVADHYGELERLLGDHIVNLIQIKTMIDPDDDGDECVVVDFIDHMHQMINDSGTNLAVGPAPVTDVQLLRLVAGFVPLLGELSYVIASNPNTEGEVLEEMLEDVVETLMHYNPQVDFDPYGTDLYVILAGLIAEHPHCPPDLLDDLAYHGASEVRHAVAGNVATPRRALKALAQDKGVSPRVMALGPGFVEATVRGVVAGNISTPVSVLSGMADGSDRFVFSEDDIEALLPSVCCLGHLEEFLNQNELFVRRTAVETLKRRFDGVIGPFRTAERPDPGVVVGDDQVLPVQPDRAVEEGDAMGSDGDQPDISDQA